MRRLFLSALMIVGLSGGAIAQDGSTTFGDKLGVMPVSNTNSPMIGGTGEVEAKLEGNTLKLTGSYKGLRGDATGISLHQARPGMAGPEFAKIDLKSGKAGEIDASFDLTDDQVKALKNNEVYAVVLSSRSKTGELRAWLMGK